jgi:hypothetical protein
VLYPNGQRAITFPGTRIAGNLAASGQTAYSGIGGARFNRYVSGTYSKVIGAVPSGYSGRAYVLAVKRGGLAAFSGLQITSSATGGLGLPGFGDASISFIVDDATGQLISSGSGTALLSFTAANALLTASISGLGTASLTLATNAPLLGAKAGAVGSASFVITGTLTPYAIGSMTGSTVDTSVLTVDTIAAGILAAALTNPIHADIRRVNSYVVSGNGQTGTEWGPV